MEALRRIARGCSNREVATRLHLAEKTVGKRGRIAGVHGPRVRQASYDEVRLTVRSTPTDVVQLSDEWIYALAHIEGEAVAHSDGSTSTFRATRAWLLHRLPPGEWRLARHIWNMRP